MKNIILIILIFLFAKEINAQNIKIDSVYNETIDTVSNKERLINYKVYAVSRNKKWLVRQRVFKPIDERYNSFYPPIIMKVVYNENDGLVYQLTYSANISICKYKVDGTTNFECPYEYDTKEFWEFYGNLTLPIAPEIHSYFADMYLILKDIYVWIYDKTMYVRCYELNPQIVSFSYDFNLKEWSKLEVRDLTEEEIAECGLYETENK